jgi:aspartyl-tRNA(Asn)/glutamyl-tRNA(Gln) amidotransferase subunit C
MILSREDVEKVSLLGRLKLTPAELGTMTSQLTAIVGYVEQLKELDTTNVEPMAHAMELRNVFALDELRPSLPRPEALANAAKKDSECYRVPAVLGE